MEICRDGRPGRSATSSAPWTRPRIAGVELLVSPHELRLPAQGQRRDRLPLHERHAGRPGARLRPARQGRRASTSTPGARGWPRAGRTSPTATPTPWSSPSAASGRATGWSWRRPATVAVKAKVAFAARTPLAVAHGGDRPGRGPRLVGDTVNLHGPRREGEFRRGRDPPGRARRQRPGGRDAAKCRPTTRSTSWSSTVPIERSSWVALRHFPQMHTNPVEVLVGGRPIRASRRSALWCSGADRAALACPRPLDRPGESATRPARPSTGPSRPIAGSRPRPPRGADLTGRLIRFHGVGLLGGVPGLLNKG